MTKRTPRNPLGNGWMAGVLFIPERRSPSALPPGSSGRNEVFVSSQL